MENLTGETPPVRYLPCVVPCKLYFYTTQKTSKLFVGTFLIATKGNPTRMQLSAAGLVLGLLAAAGVVIYTLLSRPIISDWGNLSVTGWGMLIGGLVLFLGTRAWILPANLDSAAWLMIAVDRKSVV